MKYIIVVLVRNDMVDNNAPRDVRVLYVRMLQESVGVTEPATPVEIAYELGTVDVHEPIETVLHSMVGHGLARDSIEVVPNQNHRPRELRLIKEYQLSRTSLEEWYE